MAPLPDDAPADLDDAATESDEETLHAKRLETVLAPHLTTRQRAARILALISTVLLAFVLLFALVPDVRLGLQRVFIAPTAVPTSPLAAGADALWFTPLAPGETLELDGHVLTAPPQPGDSHPLTLSRGIHQLEWQAAPFQPQNCILSVPRSPYDNCPTSPALQPDTLPAGRILDDSESFATLADPQHLALVNAIYVALATSYTTTVQPGEYYRVLDSNAFSPTVNPAPRQLRADLFFAEASGWTEPCAISPLVACRAQGQDCEQLCTLSPTADSWYVGLTVAALWTYTASDGRVLEQGAPDASFNFTLLVLRTTWDGANWHVTPVLSAMPGLAATQDATCSALASDLNAWVQQDAQRFVEVRTEVRYASDGNPTDGCVGVVTATRFGNADPPTPITGPAPLVLHRFGVLLAANAEAHALWPHLPVADAAESTLAARMAA